MQVRIPANPPASGATHSAGRRRRSYPASSGRSVAATPCVIWAIGDVTSVFSMPWAVQLSSRSRLDESGLLTYERILDADVRKTYPLGVNMTMMLAGVDTESGVPKSPPGPANPVRRTNGQEPASSQQAVDQRRGPAAWKSRRTEYAHSRDRTQTGSDRGCRPAEGERRGRLPQAHQSITVQQAKVGDSKEERTPASGTAAAQYVRLQGVGRQRPHMGFGDRHPSARLPGTYAASAMSWNQKEEVKPWP